MCNLIGDMHFISISTSQHRCDTCSWQLWTNWYRCDIWVQKGHAVNILGSRKSSQTHRSIYGCRHNHLFVLPCANMDDDISYKLCLINTCAIFLFFFCMFLFTQFGENIPNSTCLFITICFPRPSCFYCSSLQIITLRIHTIHKSHRLVLDILHITQFS